MTYLPLHGPLDTLPVFVSPDMREPTLQDMCADPIFLAILKRDGLPVSEFQTLMKQARSRLSA
jgi:hypothetical protein